MRIHKEAPESIIFVIVILTLVNVLIFLTLGSPHPFTWIVLAGSVFLVGLVLNFFRNPKRPVSAGQREVVSPADGTVVVIEETEETEFLKEKCLQISVFMSVWDVHVNRFSLSGDVIYSKYRRGKYLLARNPKSSELNEAHTTAIQTEEGERVVIRQIAGIMARRVECYAQTGSTAQKGDELGFIKFGSRADIFLPLGSKAAVKLGDKVKGNLSVIAELG